MKTVVLPSRGEFGLKLMYHVPAVHALRPDVILRESGEECLYPSVPEHITVSSPADEERRGMHPKQAPNQSEMRKWRRWAEKEYPGARIVETKPSMPGERFVPEPTITQVYRARTTGPEFDVFLAPRWRTYGAKKNWEHWVPLMYELEDAIGPSSMFIGGERQTTHPEVVDAAENSVALNVCAAWEHERVLDATIEGMLLSRVVVSTDAGLAHLAILVGRPLILITHAEGIVAPGSVDDPDGRPMEPAYWPVKMERFKEANHQGVPIEVVHHAWYSHEPVLERVASFLKDGI